MVRLEFESGFPVLLQKSVEGVVDTADRPPIILAVGAVGVGILGL